MSRYPHPDLNTLPDDIRARILEVQEKSGFIPNVFLAFARRPAEWRAFFAYHDALMLKDEGSLTKGEREMIVTTSSSSPGGSSAPRLSPCSQWAKAIVKSVAL